MAAKEISVKRYVVRLSADEREQLEALIRKGKSPAHQWAFRVERTASGVRTRSSTGLPSTTLVSTADTSRSTRGRNWIRRHAFWLARSVASRPAPPA